MNLAQAQKIAKRVAVRPLKLNDRIMTPRGETLYHRRLELPGMPAFVFLDSGRAMGVTVIKPGSVSELRYCDREGRIHVDTFSAATVEHGLKQAMESMAKVAAQMLGERHPLAEAASANRRPA